MLKNLLIIIGILSFCIYGQTDPNNDPNWDWTASSTFTVYPQALGYQVNTTSPFYQGGISEAVFDNKPEDGWVLVMRDFGTSTRNASVPYFALYNKYEGILRVFPYVVINGAYTKGFINIYWGTTLKTAALTFLKNTAWGINSLDSTKNNSSASYGPVINANWAFADFPIAYEYNASSFTNPRFHFEIWGSTTSNVDLTIQGDLLQHFGSNQPANLPDPGFFQPGGTFQLAQKHVQGTQSTWTGWKDIIKNIGKSIDSNTTSSALLNLKNAIGSLSSSWTISSLGAIGAAVGLVDFFITGGRLTQKEKPAPMNFKANFTANGTISTNVQVAGEITLPLPGSNITSTGTATNLLYNYPLGILNLRETPIVEHRKYDQPEGPGITRETHSFRVKSDLIFDLNPYSNLEIDDIKAALVYVPVTKPMAQEFLSYADQGYSDIDNTTIEIESATDSVFRFRTPYVNANSVKYQKITIPTEALNSGFNVEGGEWIPFNMPLNSALGKIYLKIHATLLVKNSSPDRQPVVFVATYNVINQGGDGINAPWPTPPSPFTVNITRKFEFEEDEVLPTEYGFIGSDNVVVTAPSSINGAVFSSWNDGNTNLLRTFTSNTSIQTLYKVVNKSNNPNAFANNGERKFIKTNNGNLHLVYESMGHVWYERSTDSGATWQLMNNGKPIDNGIGGRSPSIATFDGPGINDIFITYQGKNSNDYKIMLKKFNTSGQEVYTEMVKDVGKNYSEDATPVISISNPYGQGIKVMIIWRENYYSGFQPGGVYYRFGKEDPYGQFDQWLTYDTKINGTDGDAVSPTMTAFQSDFYLAWEDNSSIKYCTLSVDAQDNITPSSIETPSSGNGYTNFKPSIGIYSGSGSPVIAWIIEHPITYVQEVQLRIKYNNNNWSQFWSWGYGGGDNIYNANINNNEDGKFVLAWGGDDDDQYITSHSTTNVYNLSTHGDVQVSNAEDDMSDMKITSFDRYNSVKEFTTLAVINGIYKSNGQNNVTVSKGIVVSYISGKDTAVYMFDIGGIESAIGGDGNKNLFSDSFKPSAKADSSNKSAKAGIVETKTFLLTDNSNFTLKTDYSSRLSSSFTNDKVKDLGLKFKVNLIDAETGEVLEELPISPVIESIDNYKSSGYTINTDGIGNKEVKLRLEVESNKTMNTEIFTSVVQDSGKINKESLQQIVLKGDEILKDYALNQNYPNPFNPSTIISYQIPKDGFVTLKIYDILGREITTLVNEFETKGKYNINFNTESASNNLSSGVYFYQLTVNNEQSTNNEFSSTKKLILMK